MQLERAGKTARRIAAIDFRLRGVLGVVASDRQAWLQRLAATSTALVMTWRIRVARPT
jgi:hypothetical protein